MKDFVRGIVVRAVRAAVSSTGGVLLSGRAHEELLAQRRRAVGELTELEEKRLAPGLSCVIVSSDRALQLYALLETYFKFVGNPAPVAVIYKSSAERHEASYAEVAEAFGGSPVPVEFVRERGGFRDTLIGTLARTKTRNIIFLTDDNIFLRPIDFRFAAEVNPLQSVLSLRHSPHLRRSYTARTEQLPPRLLPLESRPGLLRFRWFEQGAEWSDPWSVDGHVLATAEVSVLTRLSDFRAPNTYEAALKSFNDLARTRVGLCYEESVIVNLPMNRVQSEVENRCGGVSADYLLDRWNEGLALDAGKFEALIPRSTHEEHPIVFKRRPDAGRSQ